jgi:anti-sigma regulatory factor (Ser/Thr protein kinase)
LETDAGREIRVRRTGTRYEQQLPRNADAPGLARRSLARWCGEALTWRELHRARLLASELVTNAVMHGVGEIQLRADLDENRLLVEVLDRGRGFEYEVREVGIDQVGKRGLWIVDAFASRWGLHEGTTHVWFEIERAGPRLGSENQATPGES